MIELLSLAQLLRKAPWRLRLLHSISQDRVFWIAHGQGRAVLAGRRWGLGAGNLIFVPKGHGLSMDITANATGRILVFDHDPVDLWPSRSLVLRAKDMATQTEFTSLLDAISREDHATLAHSEQAKAAHLQLMAIWLTRKLESIGPSPKPGASERLIAAFLMLVEAEHDTGAPMADYAARLGVTPTHLSRACRDKLGRTAAELLTERAVYAARDALETSDAPIKEIAHTLGFGSPAYFSRFVLSHTGKSPSGLRAGDVQV